MTVVADAAAAFSYPDEATALRGLISPGPCVRAIEHSGEDAVRIAVSDSIGDDRQDDGSYRFENVRRLAIGRSLSARHEGTGGPDTRDPATRRDLVPRRACRIKPTAARAPR